MVRIVVDRNGKVIKATPGVKGTTNNAPCLLEPARKTAFMHRWNLDSNAPTPTNWLCCCKLQIRAIVTYQETIDWMFAQLPMYQNQGGKALNHKLDKSRKFDAYLEHPHKSYKCIHVAGTNGKGSL